eukprot:5479511-Amphidinium_carterae.3
MAHIWQGKINDETEKHNDQIMVAFNKSYKGKGKTANAMEARKETITTIQKEQERTEDNNQSFAPLVVDQDTSHHNAIRTEKATETKGSHINTTGKASRNTSTTLTLKHSQQHRAQCP